MKVANKDIPETLMSLLIKHVRDHMGLHFRRENRHTLQRGISTAAQEFGFSDSKACIEWLVSAPLTKDQIEILAGHLTIGETYFFREKKSFEILEKQIFPKLISSRQKGERCLRIWSAACATGEEPYSIAILLSKMIPNLKEWNINILATDINTRFLKKASKGVYSKWSFRDTPPDFREKYFTKTKEHYHQIHPYIKELVNFSCLNLVEDTYPSLLNNTNAIDIIFCRNVLMYFDADRVKNIVKHLYRSLIDGGWLIVSPVETAHVRNKQFVVVNFPDATFYKKDIKESQRVEEFTVEMESNVTFLAPIDSTSESLMEVAPTTEFNNRDVRQEKVSKEDLNQYEKTAEVVSKSSGLYTEALALYEQGRYFEVEEKLFEQVSHNQDNSKAVILLARAYANQGKLTEAIECCKRAITVDKLDPGYYYLCATVLDEQGQVAEAVKFLKKTLYLDQDFVLAHFAMGNLYRKQGKPRESEKHYDNALQLLSTYQMDDVPNESEGITAGRLSEIIKTIN